jgi:4-hydroxybenzoate polyprenyltransferase
MLLAKIRAYFRLGRIHSAVLTGLAPVCTAAAIGRSLTLHHYLELFLIGFLFHIYLFTLNEVRDIDIDKTSKNLAIKPLVDGSISLKNAKGIVFSSVALILILTLVFFFGQAFILIPIGLVALALGGVYDFIGKRFPHADYFIALMFFFVALYGGFSVSTTLGLFVYVIALLAMVQMLINNILAGLKDVDHDYATGGLSTPIRMGVRVEGERFLVSTSFIAYIVLLKMAHISLTVLPFITRLMSFESWQFYIVLVPIIIAVFFMVRVLTMKVFNREKIMRAIGFHEIFAFMVIPFLLLGYIGYEGAVILIFLPVIWLGVFLVIMYGRLMPAI